MSTIIVDDSIFGTRRRVCVASDVEHGEILAVKAYFSWLNGLRLSASSSCPLVDVDVVDTSASWKPNSANSPLFSLAAKGLSRAACKWRNMNHPVAWSQPLSIALPQQQNQIQTPNEAWGWAQQIPEMFPLLPLCGYTCCITGFLSSSSSTSAAQDADGYKTKALITQRLEQLGAHMQPRLDHSVDVLLVPWPDLGEITSERWTAKVHFAIKASIPVLCAEQFAVIAASGVQAMEDLVRLYALPRREDIGGNTTVETNDGNGTVTTDLLANEKPLLGDFSSTGPRRPSLVVEPPSANLPDDQLMAHELSDEEVIALYTPMWVVLFGMTMAEQQAARRHLSRLHDLQITQQPVLTSTTTHIVVGKAVEAIAPVKGNRDALEQFLTRLHRLPLSRIKTSQWLESLSGLDENGGVNEDEDDDRAPLHRLRVHYDACSLFSSGSSDDARTAPQLLLNGFLAPLAEQHIELIAPKAKHTHASIRTGDIAAEFIEVGDDKSLQQQGHPTGPVKPATGMQPILLVKELADLLRGIWPHRVDELLPHTSVLENASNCNDMMSSLMTVMKSECAGNVVFDGMTFVCLEDDATKSKRAASAEKLDADHGTDEKWSFALHRLAAVRLIIKCCGGTLLRKTESEMRTMLEEGHEWFRSATGQTSLAKRRRTSPLEFVAIVPHAHERSTASAMATSRKATKSGKQPTPPLAGGGSSSLRGKQRQMFVAQKSVVDQLWIPIVTTTWLQAVICNNGGCNKVVGFSSKVKRSCLRGARDDDTLPSLAAAQRELHSLEFLRHFPLQVHPLAALITAASLPNLERVLPLGPSPFLTTLRYVKHRRAAASNEDGMTDHLRNVGHGIVVMFVCRHLPHPYYITAADKSALQTACASLGGCMEPLQSSWEDGSSRVLEMLPLERVTHIVTNDTVKVTTARPGMDEDARDEDEKAHHSSRCSPFALLNGDNDDNFVSQREILRCAVLASQQRDDIVVVDLSWVRQSVATGYFVDEAEFVVGPFNTTAAQLPSVESKNELPTFNPPSSTVGMTRSHTDMDEEGADDSKFDALGDVMTNAVSRLEKSIGEANTSVLSIDTPMPLSRKRSRSDVGVVSSAPVKAEPGVSHSSAGVMPETRQPAVNSTRTPAAKIAAVLTVDHSVKDVDDVRRREESPTAAHCVAERKDEQKQSAPAQGAAARIYVLSSVPKLTELQDAVTTRLSQPLVSLPAPGGTGEPPCMGGTGGTSWTHLVWASTSTGADIIVTNEVSQRESVLFAMAAGAWLVTDAFIWDSYREHRLCSIEQYEWGPQMLKDPKKTTLALASNISHWRRLRQECCRGAFGAPCIRQVILIGSTIASTLSSIVRAGGGNADFLMTPDGATDAPYEELAGALARREAASREVMCHRHQQLIVILIRKDATPAYLGQITSMVQLWLAGLRHAKQIRPVDAMIHSSRESCSYPGHQSTDGGDAPLATSSLCVEVHSHDWVSAVLQRRTSSMATRMLSEEL